MHSSRMRTPCTLTICPKEILEKKIGDASRKIGDPPEKLENPPLEKLETLPKNWRTPQKIGGPPRKMGEPLPPKIWRTPPL